MWTLRIVNHVKCHVIRIKTDSIGSFHSFKVKAECLYWLCAETWLALETLGFELPWPVLHFLNRGKPYTVYLTYILWRVFKIILQRVLGNNFLTGLLKVERIESKYTTVVGIIRIFLALPYSRVTVCRLPSILMSTFRLVYS